MTGTFGRPEKWRCLHTKLLIFLISFILSQIFLFLRAVGTKHAAESQKFFCWWWSFTRCLFLLSYQEGEAAQLVKLSTALFQLWCCLMIQPMSWAAETRKPYLFSSSQSHFSECSCRIWLSFLPALIGLSLLMSMGARSDQCKETGQKVEAFFNINHFAGIERKHKNLCSLCSHCF